MGKSQIDSIKPGTIGYRDALWNIITQAEICDLLQVAMGWRGVSVNDLAIKAGLATEQLEAFLTLDETMEIKQLASLFYALGLSLVVNAKPLPNYNFM